MRNFTIWNSQIQIEDWRDFLKEEFPDKDPETLLSDGEAFDLAYVTNQEYLEDERRNLDIDMGNPIIVIGDLGLWDGRKPAVDILLDGNIKDCLRSRVRAYSDCHWYLDRYGDLRCDEAHHDGVNHYLYRMVKPTQTGKLDCRIENLVDKIMTKVLTREDLLAYTKRLGDPIAEVYGWHIFRGKVAK